MSKSFAMSTTCVAALALAAVRPARAEEPPTKLPLVFQDDFEKGADRWQPFDKAVWKVKKTDAGNVYSQFDKKSGYKPPHRSPVLISLVKDHAVTDFVLDAKCLSTERDYGHRDMCLAFGYQDPAHFYYVHLGKQTDDHANQIFIVNDKPRAKISTKTSTGTNWDDKWRHVRVARDVTSGSIEVYFDDMKTPVMTATDKTFAHGRVGLGTFDDTGDWDDVKLYGKNYDKQ